jgi:hypothetical protein
MTKLDAYKKVPGKKIRCNGNEAERPLAICSKALTTDILGVFK